MSWVPSRKWIAGAVTGVLTIVGHAVASGGWDTTEWGELVALGIALSSAYLIPNDSPQPDVPVPPANLEA